jgi:hypothetical protein
VNRSTGLVALLGLAILAILGAVAITRPVRIEPNGHAWAEPTVTVPVDHDGGSLDSLLDGVRIEHHLNHGR